MYKFKEIENKWIDYWDKNKTFKTTNNSKDKYYVLDMFPYPSGSGLHVGHPEGYTATDIIARYKRLLGFDVLHPIGWDAFGLPAEQYALKTGHHPWDFTIKNIAVFKKQLKSLGFSFDYDKEINTTDPKYYKWTQWIFKKIYEKGLAEQRDADVNWCPELGCVLANEEVIVNAKGENVSEVGGFPVFKKPMRQWVLKITDYADRLLEDLNDLDWPESLKKLQTNWIGRNVDENGKVTYHLKDWLFARQRYWGEPFPLYFDEEGNTYLSDDIVELPYMENIKTSGTGHGPLANNKEWLHFEKDGKKFIRDTNTMPQWAGSSWYYLAYILKNEDGSYLDLNSKEAYKLFEKWLPVDLYIGGQEHAVLHLLYARFWHKVLYDIGVVPTKEPFQKLVNQGMILGPDNQKMSKSLGNVINPDEIVENYGADTLRVYEMFMGPLTETKVWSELTVQSTHKWLSKVYETMLKISKDKHFVKKTDKTKEIVSAYNKFIKEATQCIENLKFNILISKMMVFLTFIIKAKEIPTMNIIRDFAIILSTVAPFLGEEILHTIGEKEILKQIWPKYDESLIIEEEIIIAIQINGKLRDTIQVNEDEEKDDIISRAKQLPKIAKFLDNKKIEKIVFLKNKILNFIVNED